MLEVSGFGNFCPNRPLTLNSNLLENNNNNFQLAHEPDYRHAMLRAFGIGHEEKFTPGNHR